MKQENPAKAFLRRYIAVSGRISALQRAIDRELERAANTSITLKEIRVQSSPAHDMMESNIVKAVDATAQLQAEIDKANEILREILRAINYVKDEQQKELLTRRYITGQDFRTIGEEMHYSETRVFVIHGRALLVVNEWLRRANIDKD